jgi:hypothetical protein
MNTIFDDIHCVKTDLDSVLPSVKMFRRAMSDEDEILRGQSRYSFAVEDDLELLESPVALPDHI